MTRSTALRVMLVLSIAAARAQNSPQEPNHEALRKEVADLSAEGKLEAALSLIEGAAPSPGPVIGHLLGKLELRGEDSRRGFETGATGDSSGDAVQGESLFRLGQLHYAASRYHLAIPKFREYLSRYPGGAWREVAAYWMAYSCLLLAEQPSKSSYRDSGLHYLEALEKHAGTTGSGPDSQAYYRPLAHIAKTRLLLAKGDTAGALVALEVARGSAPSEEMPGALWLTARAHRGRDPTVATRWEDSLRRAFPASLESRVLSGVPARRVPPPNTTAPAPTPIPLAPIAVQSRFTLQLGAFSLKANADQLGKRLAAKSLASRIEEVALGERRIFRVLFGEYPSADSARAHGEKVLKPLGYTFQIAPL